MVSGQSVRPRNRLPADAQTAEADFGYFGCQTKVKTFTGHHQAAKKKLRGVGVADGDPRPRNKN